MKGTKEIDHLLPALLRESAELAHERLPIQLDKCESPIEQLFFCAVWARGSWVDRLEFEWCSTIKDLCQCAVGNPKAVCAPQVQVGSFRVDFLFAAQMSDSEPSCLVAVECDGHEFHEKTKQQAARDKSRDRELMSYGVKVFRFTGSEIWKNPGACADEVLAHLWSEWGDSLYRHEQRIIKEFGSVEAYLTHNKTTTH
jgi:very-short-patch-repair endonuclease